MPVDREVAHAVPPEPWRSFLQDFDTRLKGAVALRCLGGFVVTQQYGIGRGTSDIDFQRCRRHAILVTGRTQVVDADLTDYFGSIPHAQLMKSVARRVVDRHVLVIRRIYVERIHRSP